MSIEQKSHLPLPLSPSLTQEPLDLSKGAFGETARDCRQASRSERSDKADAQEVGPHIKLLKDLGAVANSYSPVAAGKPQCSQERRFKLLQEKAHLRLERRGSGAHHPKNVQVIDLCDVLASQKNGQPIQDFKEFLDRAGVEQGKRSYLAFPDGTVSEVRRRKLDSPAVANEVLWVETFAAVGHLYNLMFSERGTQLVQPIPYDVRGFFDRDARIAVMPMIEKRKGRSLSAWGAESRILLETAVHELEHGRGGGEYQARAAGEAYLYRNGLLPTAGAPELRLKSIALGSYSAEEYSIAVGDTMRDLHASVFIAPARLPDSRVENVLIPMIAASSLGSFESKEAKRAGSGADLLSYGLAVQARGHRGGRNVWVRHEGPSSEECRAIGERLPDRILRETLKQGQIGLRIIVGEAVSHYVAHETMKMVDMLVVENPTSAMISNLADKIVGSIEPGDLHLAVRDYVRSRGGAAVIPHGKDTVWINSLPEGVALRNADSVTIFFASPRHRGSALHIPMQEGDSYGRIAERVQAFQRDVDSIDALFARRPGTSVWESVEVPQIAHGARYLFPALESVVSE